MTEKTASKGSIAATCAHLWRRAQGVDNASVGLLALVFVFPIAYAAVFFPTPAEDLREQINWGSTFLFYTSKHPPLQTWLAQLVALTSARDAWAYILLAQLLNLAGLIYAVRIAREFIDPKLGWPVAIAFCGSIAISAEVVTTALNADQILGPLWLAVLYHALRAAREDRWRDWLACGSLAALALLAKYFSAAFLVALASALIVHKPALLRRPKPYVAALVCLAVLAGHLASILPHPSAISYAARLFNADGSLPFRALSLLRFVVSFVLLELPLLLALVWLWRRGDIHAVPAQPRGLQRVILLTTAVLVSGLAALVVGGILKYYIRYSAPLLPLCVLSLFCIIRIRPEAVMSFARVSLAFWAVGAIGGLAYALTFIGGTWREPADDAAALIRANWERHYGCGPAYVVGEQFSAHAIGLYYGGSVIGLSLRDYWNEAWVDHERIAKLGLILVTDPERRPISAVTDFAAPGSPVFMLELPYRRTLRSAKHVYYYYFVPPKVC